MENFEEFYSLKNFDDLGFENDEIDLTDFNEFQDNVNVKKEKKLNLKKIKDCVPHLYFKNLCDINNKNEGINQIKI